MRVLIVASDYAPTVGGVQTAVRHIALNLSRLGHAVTIASALPSGSVPSREIVDGIAVHRLPWGRRPLITLPFRAVWTLVQMGRAITSFKPDLVYIHFLTINALYVLLLHYVLRFKLVASARGNDIQGIPNRSRGQRWMLTRLFRRADAVLFCSSFVQHDAARFLVGVGPRTYVGVVGDGFDGEEFKNRRPHVLADSRGRPQPYLLAMGRLVHKKGFDLLLRAFARIAPEYANIHLLIAGDGEERASLEACIREAGLQERAKLLGFPDRNMSLALFLGCEFFVLSSRIEPFGIVVVEAMAAGKAVVATRSGGVVDLIQPGINGLLVEPSEDGLAEGMHKLLADPGATRAMGERAAQSIGKHTWRAVTEQFLQVFQRVVAE